MVDDIIITLGYRYLSDIITGADLTAPVLTPSLQLSGQPGTRAPHVWLRRDGERISTIDLFWDNVVLLTTPDGAVWARVAREVAAELEVPLRAYIVGADLFDDEDDRDWASVCGVRDGGALLVRPDAFVAWRSPGPPAADAEPASALRTVLSRLVGREPIGSGMMTIDSLAGAPIGSQV